MSRGPIPALRILALIALSALAVLSRSWWTLGTLAALPLLWWVAHGRSPLELLRMLRRVAVMLSFLVLSFMLFPPDGGGAIDGVDPGLRMSLRLLTIVMGSLALRATGRPGDLLGGLRQLRLPLPVAQTIDASLALLGDGGRRHGEGRRRRRREATGEPQPRQGLRALLRDRQGAGNRLLEGFRDTVARTEAEITGPAADRRADRVASDAAVVAALAVMSMTIKFVKVLPGLPVAPGHKNLVILPLYVVGARLTRSRLGATWMGTTLGVVAFLYGEGRFGALELVKYIVPGLLVDLVWPLVRRHPNLAVLTILGLVMGVARFASTLLAGWIAQAPPFFYALAAAAALPQFAFATASGAVSWGALRLLERRDLAQPPAPAAASEDGGVGDDGGGRGGPGAGSGGGGGDGSGGGRGGGRKHETRVVDRG